MSLCPVSPPASVRRRGRRAALRAGLSLALLLALGRGAGAAPPEAVPGLPGPAPSLKELAGASDYVFRGTVVRPGAANLQIVEPSERTAVVRVDEVLQAAPQVDDFTGREVTMILSRPGALRAGESQVFFGTVGLAGESLGILELGRSAPGDRLKARLARAQEQLFAEAVQAKIADADLAVQGRVLSARATYREPKSGTLSEHDPLWWEAQLEVKAVLQGTALQATIPFWFPTGSDAMWATAPRAVPGSEGIWLLHLYEVEGRAPVFAVLRAGDLLTAAEAKVAEKRVKP